jgi:hypothetical protein
MQSVFDHSARECRNLFTVKIRDMKAPVGNSVNLAVVKIM